MKITRVCLAVLILSLLIIGIVSHTPLRHVIQCIPSAVMLLLAKKSWSKYAASGIFLFWLFIVSLIWLFLLGLANIIDGTFSVTEIAMTILIGVSCVTGIVSFFYVKTTSKALSNIVAFFVFLLFQVAMMWLSFQGAIATS